MAAPAAGPGFIGVAVEQDIAQTQHHHRQQQHRCEVDGGIGEPQPPHRLCRVQGNGAGEKRAQTRASKAKASHWVWRVKAVRRSGGSIRGQASVGWPAAATERVGGVISRDPVAGDQQQGETLAAARSRRRSLLEKPKALTAPNRGRGPGTWLRGNWLGSEAMLTPPPKVAA